MRFRIPFRITIVAAMLIIIVILTGASLVNVWLVSSRTATVYAEQLFSRATQIAGEQMDLLINETLLVASLGATQAHASRFSGDGLDAPVLTFLFTALEENPALYSLYFGFGDGRFLQVISVRGDRRITAMQRAPDGTRWILRAIGPRKDAGPAVGAVHPNRVESWTFLDTDRRPIGSRVVTAPDYDPRKRPWYVSALTTPQARLSKPYIYHSLQQPGITASKRLSDDGGVFGADITLTRLSDFVSKIEISERGGLVVYDEEGRILGMSTRFGASAQLAPLAEVRSAALQALRDARQAPTTGAQTTRVVKQGQFLVRRKDWRSGGRDIGIAAIAPLDDFVGHIDIMQKRIIAFTLFGLAVFVPLGMFLSKPLSQVITEMARDARRIGTLDFSGNPFLDSRIIEFYELGRAFFLMKSDLSVRTNALGVAEEKLSRLVTLGTAMSAENETDRLMEMIVVGAKEISHAEGGTLYILDEGREMTFRIFHNDRLRLALASGDDGALGLPPVPLFDENGDPNRRHIVSHCIHEGTTINIADAYDCGDFDFSGTRAFDERNCYRSQSFITVPLKPHGGAIIGALQLINARADGGDETIPFSAEIQGFIEALAAQAATALENRNLLDAQEQLMDSMIELLAGAIDAKSPYTGGHCARVPELALMLAEEACRSDAGTLSDFRFETDEQWREFRIGAWLHDCGKVVTPEHVTDKATKLETVYNRIHEVRTRFEVLLRDAEIEKLEAIAAGTGPAEAERQFDARKQALIEDFAFVAKCNIGGEFMEEEDLARLRSIAETPWRRHFDDRLGLSSAELERYDDEPGTLPAVERLLADRPHHLVPRQGNEHQVYEQYGFKLDIPDSLYDYGEVKNLSIGRGTLSAEERFKINEHIMHTIMMLEHLPFPKHLRRVPEYAGTHHEALSGAGYPRGLTTEDLSVPARIMAIADIFEALTASDRPYKKAKTLSEAVQILSFFKKDGHIDPQLFDLFLTSGVYRRYAETYLEPGQIDDVDIGPYLG